MNIQTTLLLITACVNSLLSLFVLFGKKDKINIIYSLFVLFASFWSIGLGFFIWETDLERSLYIANFYYFAAAGIPLFFLYFSIFFLRKNEKLTFGKYLLSLPFLIISFFIFYDKNFLIKEVFFTEWGKDVIINYKNYIIYTFYFVLPVLFSYYQLFKTYKSVSSPEEKEQLKFIIVGTTIGFIFGMIFDLFLPLFGNYKYIFIGPLFSLFMVFSIAYSITKHHLFDMKVVATETLMFLLWISLLVRTFVSASAEEQIINGVTFLVTVVVGIFLIKSVIKEVALRQKIQKIDEQLRLANQGQTNLIRFMNHQVKGRLGNVKNIFAELLTNDYGVMPEDSKFLLKKGLEEANLGVNYVQGILKGSSAENGTLNYQMNEIDLGELVGKVFEEQKTFAEEKGLKINLDKKEGEYRLMGDSTHLSEAVKNLIDNSIHYTLEGSINLELSSDEHKVTFKIKDTGIGLSDSDKSKLFKSGGRGEDSLKINVNSTGYGLAFVKGVIIAHKGRVWAESEGKGKGSTFVIELPKK